MSLTLDLATVDKLKLDGEQVEKVLATGELGEMMLLPNHTNLITSLGTGSFAYFKDNIWHWACLSGGFLQVAKDKVIVLAESMEFAHEIDIKRAKKDIEAAEKKIKEHPAGSSEYKKAVVSMEKAKARILSSEKSK